MSYFYHSRIEIRSKLLCFSQGSDLVFWEHYVKKVRKSGKDNQDSMKASSRRLILRPSCNRRPENVLPFINIEASHILLGCWKEGKSRINNQIMIYRVIQLNVDIIIVSNFYWWRNCNIQGDLLTHPFLSPTKIRKEKVDIWPYRSTLPLRTAFKLCSKMRSMDLTWGSNFGTCSLLTRKITLESGTINPSTSSTRISTSPW